MSKETAVKTKETAAKGPAAAKSKGTQKGVAREKGGSAAAPQAPSKKGKGIHPSWYEAKVSCVCGDKFISYSTKKELKVDICSKCHPYFTGKQNIIDAEGRVEKFHARLKGKKSVAKKKETETVEA